MDDISRISSDDAVSLATDVGAVPMQVGAVLVLDGPLEPAQLAGRLAERIPSVPRLRQRLDRVPLGAGRPVWVDHERFDLDEHLEVLPREGVDHDRLLELATSVICRRLDPSRPLWRVAVVPRLASGGSAVVVVFHHVLADGIGALAVLANLLDDVDPEASNTPFPRPAPSVAALVRDSFASRVGVLRSPAASLRRVRDALVQLRPRGGGGAQRCSLNRPTGAARRVLTVEVPLEPLHQGARARGATVNDALLSAIGGALGELLDRRGESIGELVVSMPMSARRSTSATSLGNEVGAVPVHVPTGGGASERLSRVAEATAVARRTAPASSTAVLGPIFRLLAKVGIFGWFVDHQRLVHTFATNLRGPETSVQLLDRQVTSVHAVAMITGNVTASFAALSYAGTLGVSVIVDPDACPDATDLRDLLRTHLEELSS